MTLPPLDAARLADLPAAVEEALDRIDRDGMAAALRWAGGGWGG